MLFTSKIFLIYFLPVVYIAYVILRSFGSHRLAIAFLVGASLFYYAYWDPRFLILILISITVNYLFAFAISKTIKKHFLFVGVGFNLLLIFYYKYTNFVLKYLGVLIDFDIQIDTITLPLAISFFTFQQIAYIVDCYKTKKCEINFINYALFVTFFPQLIAGPIVHHHEMLPQFKKAIKVDVLVNDFYMGVGLFAMGLFKKVFIADQVAIFADQVFTAEQAGSMITCYEAWVGALAYTFQIYFDFSGYTDMALGTARIFGIYLPLNFNSPYKAVNPSDFWARWHITLSRFLRDYLYIPLGGNRFGLRRTLVNVLITMLLGGLWHGANWTFMAWGGIHGLYLIVYHTFTNLKLSIFKRKINRIWFTRYISVFFTFNSIVLAWVFFRAAEIDNAISIIKSMLDFPSLINSGGIVFLNSSVILKPIDSILWMIFLLFVVFYFPNSIQVLESYDPSGSYYIEKSKDKSVIGTTPNSDGAISSCLGYPLLGTFIVAVAMLLYMAPESSPFIYTIF